MEADCGCAQAAGARSLRVAVGERVSERIVAGGRTGDVDQRDGSNAGTAAQELDEALATGLNRRHFGSIPLNADGRPADLFWRAYFVSFMPQTEWRIEQTLIWQAVADSGNRNRHAQVI